MRVLGPVIAEIISGWAELFSFIVFETVIPLIPDCCEDCHDFEHCRKGRKLGIEGLRLEQVLDYYKTHTGKETTLTFGISKLALMRRVAEPQAHANLHGL